jgi:hypothetical protein
MQADCDGQRWAKKKNCGDGRSIKPGQPRNMSVARCRTRVIGQGNATSVKKKAASRYGIFISATTCEFNFLWKWVNEALEGSESWAIEQDNLRLGSQRTDGQIGAVTSNLALQNDIPMAAWEKNDFRGENE